MTRLAAVDAQAFWMSAVIPSDEFLLFAFAGPPGDLDDVVAGLQRRAGACPDLRLRIADDHAWTYPRWVPGDVDRAQFVTHPAGLDWAGCLDVVAGLADAPLDPTRMTWRLHVFPAVHGVPRAGAATVAVLQLVHALADGTRAAQLAAWLFGREHPVPPVVPRRRGNVVVRGLAAARAQRQLATDIAAGVLPAPPGPRPSLLTNTAPQGTRRIRTLLRQRAELPAGHSVTVAALTAVGTALAGYLAERGDDPGRLGAEVPMADIGIRHARNHFHNVGIDLRPDLAPAERADAIVDQLRAAHARAGHPAADATVPVHATRKKPLEQISSWL